MPHTPESPDAPDAPEDDALQRIDDRLVDLEVKASYADDLLEQLNDIVARQQGQIDALARALAELRAQHAGADAEPGRTLRDELPPHY